MHLTWYDSNTWLIELAGRRILLDPWFVGPLTFGNATWFFKGEHQSPHPIPENLDLILLSQGLEDHAHRPTLETLDRQVPVVGSPGAAEVARSLGYGDVTALDHGETFVLGEAVEIRATPGAPTGPTTLENGYWLRSRTDGTALYYEPHGYHPLEELAKLGPADVAIAPLVDLSVWFLPIIKGTDSALKLAKALKPQVILPTAAAGNVRYEGLLVSALRGIGSIDRFRANLAAAGSDAQVLEPTPGDRFEVPLKVRETAAS